MPGLGVSHRLRVLGVILSLMVVAVATVAGTIVADMGVVWFRHRHDVAELVRGVPATTGYMALREAEGHPVRSRIWVPLDSLPVLAVCAVVASEDPTYFDHVWFSWSAQRQLISRVLRGDFTRGGSGITQQLARNLYLTPARTARRKAREYTLAVLLAETLSKERQLELYLNLVELGDGVWGMEAGSQATFGRSLREVTPLETLVLVRLLPAPGRGPEFSLLPSRTGGARWVLTALWLNGGVDNATREATEARQARIAWHVGRGVPVREAIMRTTREMGPESSQPPVMIRPGQTWAALCDQDRRGRW